MAQSLELEVFLGEIDEEAGAAYEVGAAEPIPVLRKTAGSTVANQAVVVG